MNYERLLEKKKKFDSLKNIINSITLESFMKEFEIRFTHDSTAIEGNTLTLLETKLILEDKISVGGKDLREIYEIINHENAYNYVKLCLKNNRNLTESIILELHRILTDRIIQGGIYRDVKVFISGAEHRPPDVANMKIQLLDFYYNLNSKENINPIELAAWTHGEFVKIHPFIDGNGRTSRLIMNYQLMSKGFLPISIKKENRFEYYKTLEEYAVNNNLEPFINLIPSDRP
ncbi:MAG: Fic family protein [Lachnospirales bacterium]